MRFFTKLFVIPKQGIWNTSFAALLIFCTISFYSFIEFDNIIVKAKSKPNFHDYTGFRNVFF